MKTELQSAGLAIHDMMEHFLAQGFDTAYHDGGHLFVKRVGSEVLSISINLEKDGPSIAIEVEVEICPDGSDVPRFSRTLSLREKEAGESLDPILADLRVRVDKMVEEIVERKF